MLVSDLSKYSALSFMFKYLQSKVTTFHFAVSNVAPAYIFYHRLSRSISFLSCPKVRVHFFAPDCSTLITLYLVTQVSKTLYVGPQVTREQIESAKAQVFGRRPEKTLASERSNSFCLDIGFLCNCEPKVEFRSWRTGNGCVGE